MERLAAKYPHVKFIKSISTTCVPNYPDMNLPTVFFYYENTLKTQIIGPQSFNGMNYKLDDFEWKLHRLGIVESKLKRDMMSDFEKSDNHDRLVNAENEMLRSIRQGTLGNRDDSDEDN
jgi:hypothetical protein